MSTENVPCYNTLCQWNKDHECTAFDGNGQCSKLIIADEANEELPKW